MLNEKQKNRKPKYSYCRRRSRWAVYNELGSKVCDFIEREDARAMVYKLNGWRYKE